MQTKTPGIWSHLEKGGVAMLAESLENIYIPGPAIIHCKGRYQWYHEIHCCYYHRDWQAECWYMILLVMTENSFYWFYKFLSFLRRKASWLDPVLYCFTFPISFSTRSVRGAFGDQIKPITSVKPQFPRANSKCEKRWWSHQLRLKPWTFNIGLKWTCE